MSTLYQTGGGQKNRKIFYNPLFRSFSVPTSFLVAGQNRSMIVHSILSRLYIQYILYVYRYMYCLILFGKKEREDATNLLLKRTTFLGLYISIYIYTYINIKYGYTYCIIDRFRLGQMLHPSQSWVRSFWLYNDLVGSAHLKAMRPIRWMIPKGQSFPRTHTHSEQQQLERSFSFHFNFVLFPHQNPFFSLPFSSDESRRFVSGSAVYPLDPQKHWRWSTRRGGFHRQAKTFFNVFFFKSFEKKDFYFPWQRSFW